MGMFQEVVNKFGKALRPIHAGDDKLAARRLQRNHGPTIHVTSKAFMDGMPIPSRYTQDGENLSPPLAWSHAPSTTREFVVICEDPDAPFPRPALHWLAWGIHGHTTMLSEGIPKVAEVKTDPRHTPFSQAKNTTRRNGYAGPAPPPGHGVHHYHFQVFALDQPLRLSDSPTKEEIIDNMRGHVIAFGELVGTSERV